MNILEKWEESGTKILGWLATLSATVISALGMMTASPDMPVLVTPKQFALLSFINIILGGLTIKRGFTNTKNLTGLTTPEEKP